MAKTVVGLFDHIGEAQDAVQELVENGFDREKISLAANDASGGYARALDARTAQSEENEGEYAAKGAGIGAALGGIAGLVVGLGAIVIPGVGPVLAAGPLLATLGGLGIGALTGGMIGALSETGVPDQEARVFAEGVRRGGVLVLVEVDDGSADGAAEIMNRHQPIDLEERATSWRAADWQGFTESGEQFAFGQQPRLDQQARHPKEWDGGDEPMYGPGVRSYRAGQPVSGDAADEERFRAIFENTYAGSEKSWEMYQPAYRFGFNQAHDPRYSGETWDTLSPRLRADWERDFPGRAWAEFENAIHEGWEVGRAAD